MVLIASRRPALAPDQSVSDSWQLSPSQEGQNRQQSLLSHNEAYHWNSYYPPSTPLPFSSWDLNTQLASTPRQDASWNTIPVSSLGDNSVTEHRLTDTLATSAVNLLNASTIDQWLFADISVAPFSAPFIESAPPRVQDTSVSLQEVSLYSASSPSHNSNVPSTTSTPISKRTHSPFSNSSHITNTDTTYKFSKEITLRSLNGDTSQDIYYPQSSIIQAVNDDGQIVLITGGLPASSSPPPEDFASDLGDKAARGQPEKRRCNDDIYTPLWVRGEGINREGWCGLCGPGRWLNLKTSQYLYHMQNTHGVIQSSGVFCLPPVQLRVHDDSVSTTDGYCDNCHQWVAICTVRRKRCFSAWFEHARKCHSLRRDILRAHPPLQHRRAVSSSPAMRLRANKKEGHQRVTSLQETASYVLDLVGSPSSSSVVKHEDCDFADSDTSKRARCM